jgi:GNAT superfamily N-acetyltransferase
MDGAWRLGLTPDHPSKRLNSFLCPDTGDNANVARRLDDAIAFYARRGARPLFRHVPLTPVDVDRGLDERGWTRFDMCMVMARPRTRVDSNARPSGISVGADDWMDVVVAAKGIDAGEKEGLRRAIGRIQGKVARIMSHDADGQGVAVALAVVTDGLLGILDVVTAEEWRSKGHGRRVVQAALWWGATVGAKEAYLQVTLANTPALSLYRTLGFVDAFPYHYRAPPT